MADASQHGVAADGDGGGAAGSGQSGTSEETVAPTTQSQTNHPIPSNQNHVQTYGFQGSPDAQGMRNPAVTTLRKVHFHLPCSCSRTWTMGRGVLAGRNDSLSHEGARAPQLPFHLQRIFAEDCCKDPKRFWGSCTLLMS